MKVTTAISNGIEFLQLSNPKAKKIEVNKLVKNTSDSYYLIDGYTAIMFADKLTKKTSERVILSSDYLTYFTTTNTRVRFDDVSRMIKKFPACSLIINNIPLYNDFDKKEDYIRKISEFIGKNIANVDNDLKGQFYITIPNTSNNDLLNMYLTKMLQTSNLESFNFVLENINDAFIQNLNTLLESSLVIKNIFKDQSFKLLIKNIENIEPLLELLKKYDFNGELIISEKINTIEDYNTFVTDINAIDDTLDNISFNLLSSVNTSVNAMDAMF